MREFLAHHPALHNSCTDLVFKLKPPSLNTKNKWMQSGLKLEELAFKNLKYVNFLIMQLFTTN